MSIEANFVKPIVDILLDELKKIKEIRIKKRASADLTKVILNIIKIKADSPAGKTKTKAAAKKKPSKKPVAKKAAAKKPVAKKPAVKKAVAAKPVAKKPAVKKAVVKKPAAKKPTVKKVSVKKSPAPAPVSAAPAPLAPETTTPAADKPTS